MAETKLWDGATWRDSGDAQIWDGSAWVSLGGGGSEPAVEPWVRPAEWLPMTVTAGEQKVQALIALGGPSSPLTARQMTLKVSGAFTVDWGDGTAPENFASAAIAKHQYSGNGLTALGTVFQALVTVTAQSGQTLTSFSVFDPFDVGKNWAPPVLDVVLGPGTVTGLSLSGLNAPAGRLQRVAALTPITVAATATMFGYAVSLWEITGITVNGTSMQSLFLNCAALRTLPTLDTSQTTNTSSMFSGCLALTAVPSMDTSKVTATSLMFKHCVSLRRIPAMDTSQATALTNMFEGCATLEEIPPLNLAKATNTSSMFTGCDYLREVPALDTPALVTATYMFSDCRNLRRIPTLNTSKVTSTNGMFSGCFSLEELPPLDMALVTTSQFMFGDCQSLRYVTLLNCSALTNGSYTFNNCTTLERIDGPLNLAAITSAGNLTSFVGTCKALRQLQITAGPRYSFALAGMLDAATLNAIYTSLPTVTGQTITVTGLPGTAGDDPSIATAKGWTVTGT